MLDLGSGGGIDVLLSARRVGDTGFAYGVDMTEEMLALARANAAKAGASNVEFRAGTIENVPLPDAAVDVVISNCVINLSTDKPAVLAEMFRVLTPGGRVGVSDVVAEDHRTVADRAERGSYVGCIAGALTRAEYLDGLTGAGVRRHRGGVHPRSCPRHARGHRAGHQAPRGRVSDLTAEAPVAGPTAPVLQRLSRLDRFLPVWILAAMGLGIGLGRVILGLADALDTVKVGSVSLPIAVGLLLMMYPVLAKVRYRQLDHVTGDKQLLVTSLVLNWLVGPAFMFALAWLLLPDLPTYRTGLIIVGLARCIAMVLIWNDLSCGDREAGAVLVAINSVFQILAFGLLGWFYLQVLPGWLGLDQVSAGFSIGTIVGSVLVFLGIPLAAGFLTRTLGEKRKGQDWYEHRFLPKIGPVALCGLLFTIVVLFALQGHTITTHPWDVVRIAAPLLVYFAVMFGGSFALGHHQHLGYAKTATLAFTAAGNNFELAIAVAIGVFGITSGQALAGVVGPLIEVPVLVGLVYVALWLRRRLHWLATPAAPVAATS